MRTICAATRSISNANAFAAPRAAHRHAWTIGPTGPNRNVGDPEQFRVRHDAVRHRPRGPRVGDPRRQRLDRVRHATIDLDEHDEPLAIRTPRTCPGHSCPWRRTASASRSSNVRANIGAPAPAPGDSRRRKVVRPSAFKPSPPSPACRKTPRSTRVDPSGGGEPSRSGTAHCARRNSVNGLCENLEVNRFDQVRVEARLS